MPGQSELINTKICGTQGLKQKITGLELINNDIHAAGAQALSNALKTNASITTLTLDHNDLGGTGIEALSSGVNCSRHH